jgi:two-component system chemotaxis sensor kinase CheA
MGMSEAIRQKLIATFRAEQSEHVQTITQGLLFLEKQRAEAGSRADGLNAKGKKRQAILDEVFRAAHSLKGSARSVGITTIESLGHALEELLLPAKEGRLTLTPELFDLLYQTLDAVELVVGQIETGNSTPPASVLTLLARVQETLTTVSSEEPEPMDAAVVADSESAEESRPEFTAVTGSPQNETIRVSVAKLDALMAQLNELMGAKVRADQRLAEVHQMQEFAGDWRREWLTHRGHYHRLTRNGSHGQDKDVAALLDFSAKNQEQLHFFGIQSDLLSRHFSNDVMRLSLIIEELETEIRRVRMLPLSTITASSGRLVRDLARAQSKQITLTITGSETELDKQVLEQIKDPLIHLLRNAVDHGIETPTERDKVGKRAEGLIGLNASQQGNSIVITVSDDGKGLDLDAIRKAAVRKGYLDKARSDGMSDAEATRLVFQAGLSTSKIITDVSGRGVGLDIVRQNVEKLHGTLDVAFEPGQGTAFSMRLPLTLVSSRGLLAKASGQTFIVPFSAVERILQVRYDEITTLEGKEAITYEGRPVAVTRLGDVLGLPDDGREANLATIILIGVAEKRVGLIVDELQGEQEVVVKGLGKQLAKVGGIAGATILGNKEVVLVLHPADLMKLASIIEPRAPISRTATREDDNESIKTILVVDDSITTRTLEKNILEAAGYKVRLAIDGEEALGILVSEGIPSLIVSDIDMPRLDGFGLTSRIKQDSNYKDIPVILVTSLDTPSHKARGIEVGADAYIVKSSFDQGNLLETIEQLIL